MIEKNMLKLFVKDLLVNCACGKEKNYIENKRKEWKMLKGRFKTKNVIPISDIRFLTIYLTKF
jgi:hypothetical protein